jgi:hypothetical protein
METEKTDQISPNLKQYHKDLLQNEAYRGILLSIQKLLTIKREYYEKARKGASEEEEDVFNASFNKFEAFGIKASGKFANHKNLGTERITMKDFYDTYRGVIEAAIAKRRRIDTVLTILKYRLRSVADALDAVGLTGTARNTQAGTKEVKETPSKGKQTQRVTRNTKVTYTDPDDPSESSLDERSWGSRGTSSEGSSSKRSASEDQLSKPSAKGVASSSDRRESDRQKERTPDLDPTVTGYYVSVDEMRDWWNAVLTQFLSLCDTPSAETFAELFINTFRNKPLAFFTYPFNVCLLGEPGTGKSITAGAIANLAGFFGLVADAKPGTVEGEIATLSAQNFIAEFEGQTLTKTKALLFGNIEKALFIDEAYTLGKASSNKESSGYGQEAISEIVLFLSENVGRSFIIAAGYPEEMSQFLAMNVGLNRRFGFHIKLTKPTEETGWRKFVQFLKEAELAPGAGLREAFAELFSKLAPKGSRAEVAKSLFGNGMASIKGLASNVSRSMASFAPRATAVTPCDMLCCLRTMRNIGGDSVVDIARAIDILESKHKCPKDKCGMRSAQGALRRTGRRPRRRTSRR